MLSIISEKLVLLNESCNNKSKVLKKMVDLLYQEDRITDKGIFYNDILKREKIQSTGIGAGIAIPHSKNDAVRLISVVICICKNGINFKALDNKPVNILFMVAAPEEFNTIYLQTIAKIARLLKNPQWRDKFIKAHSKTKIVELIKEFDSMYPDRLKIDTSKKDKILLEN